MLAKQGQVRPDQGKEDGRDQPDVDAEGAAERDRPDEVTAAPQRPDEGPDEGRVGGDVRHHHRCPVSGLVPRQEGAGNGHPQHEHEEPDAGDPVELARPLVGAGEKGPHHVQADHEEQDVRGPQMDAADDGAEGVVLFQVVQAGPGFGHRRHVEQGQENAGDQLKQDEDQGGAAEGVEPGATYRYRLVEAFTEEAADRGPLVQPVVDRGDPTHQSDSVKLFWMKRVVPSMRWTYCGSGFGGGPPMFFPVMS